jgi:hypothetical protein
MDQEQVRVVLGEPVHRKRFKGQPPAEAWIYRSSWLHQDQLRTHGARLIRLVFVDGRLEVLEPL